MFKIVCFPTFLFQHEADRNTFLFPVYKTLEFSVLRDRNGFLDSLVKCWNGLSDMFESLYPVIIDSICLSAVCFRPQLGDNIEMSGFQRFYSPGDEIALSCKQGYTPVLGPRTIVCIASGEWTTTKFLCIRGSPLF